MLLPVREPLEEELLVAILTDPGGPVLLIVQTLEMQDVPEIAILTDPRGPVLRLDRRAARHHDQRVAILTDLGGPVLSALQDLDAEVAILTDQ